MSDRGDMVSADVPFKQSFGNIESGSCLGDREVLGAMLRQFTVDALESPDERDLESRTEAIAGALLGDNREYLAVPGWNRRGSIDVFLKNWLGTVESDPVAVIKLLLIQFMSEAVDIIQFGSQHGVREDEWHWQMNELVDANVRLLQGVPPTLDLGREVEKGNRSDAMRESIARVAEGWVTIGQDEDGEGGRPVLIGDDGKMKSGKFAGETMKGAFGKGGKADKLAKAEKAVPKPKGDKSSPASPASEVKPTTAEANAVADYSTDKFQQINGALRGDKPMDNDSKKIIERVDGYLAKAPKREGATVRSFVIPPGREDEFASMFSEGATFEDKAYLSTRKSPTVSDKIAFTNKITEERGVVLKVTGTSGVDISDTSLNPGESEVLYPRGTKFRVDKVIRTSNGGILAEISEIGSGNSGDDASTATPDPATTKAANTTGSGGRKLPEHDKVVAQHTALLAATKMDANQLAATRDFMRHGSTEILAASRGDDSKIEPKNRDKRKQQVELIKSAVDQNKLSAPITVYRGVKTLPGPVPAVGDDIQMAGLTSTTNNPTTGFAFSDEAGAVYELDLPAGAAALPALAVWQSQKAKKNLAKGVVGESEVLLDSPTGKVTGVRKETDKYGRERTVITVAVNQGSKPEAQAPTPAVAQPPASTSKAPPIPSELTGFDASLASTWKKEFDAGKIDSLNSPSAYAGQPSQAAMDYHASLLKAAGIEKPAAQQGAIKPAAVAASKPPIAAPKPKPAVVDSKPASEFKTFDGKNDSYVAHLGKDKQSRVSHMMNAADPDAAAADIKAKYPALASVVDAELVKAKNIKAALSVARSKPPASPVVSAPNAFDPVATPKPSKTAKADPHGWSAAHQAAFDMHDAYIGNGGDQVDEFKDSNKSPSAALQAFVSHEFVEMNADPSHPAVPKLKELLHTLPDHKPKSGKIYRVLGFEDADSVDAFVASLDKPQAKSFSSWTEADPTAPGATPMNHIGLDLASTFGDHTVILTYEDPVGAKDITFAYGSKRTGTEQLLQAGHKFDVADVKKDGLKTIVTLKNPSNKK